MSTFRQIYYQIVFGTKYREPTLRDIYCDDLYKYISGVIQAKKSTPYQINGIEDHIHIFCDLHPSHSLSDFVKDIKVSSSLWLKDSGKFPGFIGWQNGYGAFTYSVREKDMIMGYIKKQKEHHRKETFSSEFKRLLVENEVDFEDKYLL
ncbi:IS200/IS605 family transposase [Daejeonella sp. JGW-45]|uniref:IS200/IS605 family transposase n=1 Tax=Daejeonella sp. JGW-45 TaxID=3034148 RepID=UPI0023EE246A|nr:IS200/IS605 family transposase [Daejeonella sp. JGW-45]